MRARITPLLILLVACGGGGTGEPDGGASGDGPPGTTDGPPGGDDAPTGGDAGDCPVECPGECVEGLCAPVVDPGVTCAMPVYDQPVTAAGYAMMASQGNAYLFLNPTMWMVVNGGSGTTQSIPMPAGITAMTVKSANLEPGGYPLVLFTSGGTDYASFFVDGAFEPPVVLPPDTRSVHADGPGRIFAVDVARVLWERSGDTFLNRGALPVGSGNYDYFAWTVDWFGVVHLAYTVSGGTLDHLYYTRLSVGAPWTPATDLVPDYEHSLHQPYLAAALDGSLHLAYARTDFGPTLLLYRRSLDGGVTFSADEVLGGDHRLSVFAARSYADVSALDNAFSGSYNVVYRSRCGVPDSYGWERRIELFSFARNGNTIGAVDEAGRPAYLIATGAQDAVLQGH
jgi:hypothetical protein